MSKLAAALALCPFLAFAQGAEVAPASPAGSEVDADFEEIVARRGYYLSLGLGSGDGRLAGLDGSKGLGRYMGASPTRVALSFEAGATVGERLLLGLDLTWFRASAREGDLTGAIQLVQYGVAATVYPLRRGPFLRAGGGVATVELSSRGRGARYGRSGSGFGIVGGAGYGFHLWNAFDLTLRVDVTRQWLDAPEIGLDGSTFWAGYAGVSWF